MFPMNCDEMEAKTDGDKEVIIHGVSYHERWKDGELTFRYPNLFEPENHPQWRRIRRLIYPRSWR